jgi:hypothetical protein
MSGGTELDQVEPEMDTVWQLPDGAGDALAAWCKRLIEEAHQNGGRCPSLARRPGPRPTAPGQSAGPTL